MEPHWGVKFTLHHQLFYQIEIIKQDKKVSLMILEILIIGLGKIHLLKVKFFPGGIMDIKYQDSLTEL